ncbi:hypothetical protein [Hasllibacter sp. MH4015]|uniref:hypothetical protein n=1 Tax=Hasllibacter sp. MH4015 TaxID=2854029 RepID=UPI001CD5C0C0|nr:hypothetical protein [Hasllibacter sp. MH4015]
MALRKIWIGLALLLALGTAKGHTTTLFDGAAPLLARAPAVRENASPSLFTGTASGSLFAPLPPRTAPAPPARGDVAQLLSLIARAEAGRDGYDAVQHGARIRPPRAPTQMTLGEIYAWIDATPGQPHAIGRYQFIPPTLRRVAQLRAFGPDTPFTAEVQDALAEVLLEDAGMPAFRAGQLDRRRFMHNLARIWAGLPLPNGQSYYEGYAGNRAAMSWAEFSGGMDRIWPSG